jgi:hypothetical protein
MLLRFTESIAAPTFAFRHNQVVEVNEEQAKQFIKNGWAVEVITEIAENRIITARESAVLPRQGARPQQVRRP